MKKLSELPQAIYNLFSSNHEPDLKNTEALAKSLAQVISDRMGEKARKVNLTMSNLGTKCKRKLWYMINQPEKAEPLPPAAQIKFLYGDILELMMLFLAKEAGYKISGEQDLLTLHGVRGRRDAVINGFVTDVKSTSTFGYKKFNEGRLDEDDPFGYIDQLSAYMEASKDDPSVTSKDRGLFLAIDKTLGNICVDFHNKKDIDYDKYIASLRDMLKELDPPSREYDDVPDGKSGNRKLCLECSYCQWKHHCWPGLRTFLYAGKPRFLTKVEREPNVPELKE